MIQGSAVQKVYFVVGPWVLDGSIIAECNKDWKGDGFPVAEVMNNMFNTPFEIHRRYDLKGQC